MYIERSKLILSNDQSRSRNVPRVWDWSFNDHANDRLIVSKINYLARDELSGVFDTNEGFP